MKKAADKINQKLKKDPKNKKLKKAKRDLKHDFIPRKEKYEKYKQILGDRNSFSKTDSDATFMRIKEDHMRNRQLKPGYNIQMGTENQFVTGFSIHQRPGDTSCLKDHIEQRERWLGRTPEDLIAYAGYGSEENYVYLEDKDIDAYVKYNSFHYEQKRSYRKKKPYRQENFHYLPEQDQYLCPAVGKELAYQFTKDVISHNGYRSERRVYECEDCSAWLSCEIRLYKVTTQSQIIYWDRAAGDEEASSGTTHFTWRSETACSKTI